MQLLSLWLGFIATIEASKHHAHHARTESDRRIVGGKKVQLGDKPYFVAVEIYSQAICGGALVGRKTVLTAAHCSIKSNEDRKMVVRVGSITRGLYGETYPVEKYLNHPDFNPDTFDSDLSILFLMFEIYHTGLMQPIKIIGYGGTFPPGTVGEVVGLGRRQESGKGANELWSAEVPIIDDRTCRRIYGEDFTWNMFCAGYLSGGNDACIGDSGGPFVVGGYLYGIISWGIGCGEKNLPGVYTRLSKMADWLDKQFLE